MTTSTPTMVEVRLKTSIIHSVPTLDGLIAKSVYEQTKDVECAHNELPFARTPEGLWHASSALFKDFEKSHAVNITANFTPQHIGDRWKHMKLSKWSPSRVSEFGIVSRTYDAYVVGSIWYNCLCTDLELLEKHLHQFRHIGKRHRTGGAEIESIHIYDNAGANGLVAANGTVLRPIPVELAPATVSPDNIQAHASWKPAYWNKENHAICYIPPRFKSWTMTELESL